MKKIILIGSVTLCMGFIGYLFSCTDQTQEKLLPDAYSINLRWVKAYEAEEWKNIRTGMIWALSYMGASVPKGAFDQSVIRHDTYLFTIDFSILGFPEESLKKLQPMLAALKESEEYQVKNSVDIGRFLMYTLHSSWHYYTLTGVNPSIENFKHKYFATKRVDFHLSNSGIAKTQRIIRFNPSLTYQNIAFLCEEGNGDIAKQTFMAEAFETIDIMPNGQLRYGIYDKKGRLKTAADTLYTLAGKPGKCQWCHEKHLQSLFYPTVDLPNSIGKNEFVLYISQAQQVINKYREGLQTDITYDQAQDHTYAELLYISFMEPSLERIATEWGVTTSEAARKMPAFPTHIYEEYPFLGKLYKREWVDSLAAYQTMKVPQSSREFSPYEPDITGLSTH